MSAGELLRGIAFVLPLGLRIRPPTAKDLLASEWLGQFGRGPLPNALPLAEKHSEVMFMSISCRCHVDFCTEVQLWT